MESNDTRLFERFTARFPVKFKNSRNDYGTDVFLRDASASGARLTTRDRVYLNDHLAIEIELPDGKNPLILTGEVKWAKPKQSSWDVGLQFHRVNLMQIQRLFHVASSAAS